MEETLCGAAGSLRLDQHHYQHAPPVEPPLRALGPTTAFFWMNQSGVSCFEVRGG